MDLKECREKIDEIDKKLLATFIERMGVVEQVALYKKENNIPILNASREKELIADKVEYTPAHLKNYVQGFFSSLMENSRCYQHNLLNQAVVLDLEKNFKGFHGKIACPGIKGSYSHIAALTLQSEHEIDFYNTFHEVFEAVCEGCADFGIIPIENSTAGGVFEVYDLLSQCDLFINKLFKIKIEHSLVAKNTGDLSEITEIYSHNQALMQCSNFLKSHPHMQAIECDNTALAARHVSQSNENLAAICSMQSAKIYGLQVLLENIQNSDDNYTKFIVISKKMFYEESYNEISICIKIPNVSGELNKLLTKFTLYGINLNKIESRPIEGKDFDVLFYINFSGNAQSQNVAQLLGDLQESYEFVKILGTYENPQ